MIDLGILILGGIGALILVPFVFQLLMENAETIALSLANATADRQRPEIREDRRNEWVSSVMFTNGPASKLLMGVGIAVRYFISVPQFSIPKASATTVTARYLRNITRDFAKLQLNLMKTILGTLALGITVGGMLNLVTGISVGYAGNFAMPLMAVAMIYVGWSVWDAMRRPPPVIRDDDPPDDDKVA